MLSIRILVLLGLLVALFYQPVVGQETETLVPSMEEALQEEDDDSLLPLREYPNEPTTSAEEEIAYRAEVDPLNIISTIIFACSILHILLARRILALSHRIEQQNKSEHLEVNGRRTDKSFLSEILHFLGEVEIIFGIWVIPLLLAITWLYNWPTAIDYLNSRNYTEAMVVVVVMTLTSTYPILYAIQKLFGRVAEWGGGSPGAWWFTLLTLGPLLSSLITEAGAMVITAIMLTKRIFIYPISKPLSYATIGLLFTNVSVGGIATAFASPPALMAASKWQWSSLFMFQAFGWKSLLSILLATGCYYFYFRKEFKTLSSHQVSPLKHKHEPVPSYVPLWVIIGNVFFLVAALTHLHEPVVFVGSFLFFLGFYQSTRPYQTEIVLKPALLVGFFIAGLVIHAGLQEWWIAPLLDHATAFSLLMISFFLGPFADNAALVYLATFIPNLSLSSKYAVMVGAVTAGGLTVIANAPNPAGQQILTPYYSGGISPRNLFLGALLPTFIALLIFSLFHL